MAPNKYNKNNSMLTFVLRMLQKIIQRLKPMLGVSPSHTDSRFDELKIKEILRTYNEFFFPYHALHTQYLQNHQNENLYAHMCLSFPNYAKLTGYLKTTLNDGALIIKFLDNYPKVCHPIALTYLNEVFEGKSKLLTDTQRNIIEKKFEALSEEKLEAEFKSLSERKMLDDYCLPKEIPTEEMRVFLKHENQDIRKRLLSYRSVERNMPLDKKIAYGVYLIAQKTLQDRESLKSSNESLESSKSDTVPIPYQNETHSRAKARHTDWYAELAQNDIDNQVSIAAKEMEASSYGSRFSQQTFFSCPIAQKPHPRQNQKEITAAIEKHDIDNEVSVSAKDMALDSAFGQSIRMRR